MHFAFLRDLKQHGCQILSPCAFYNMGFLFHLAAAAVLFSPTLSFPSLLWLQIISVTSLTATGESWWVFTLCGYRSISSGFIQRENYLSFVRFIFSLFLESHSHQILRIHRCRQTISFISVTRSLHVMPDLPCVVRVISATLILVAFFLVGDSPASEFYIPTFRNTVFQNVGM